MGEKKSPGVYTEEVDVTIIYDAFAKIKRKLREKKLKRILNANN